MDDPHTDLEPASSGSALIPSVLAVLALLVGGAGIYLALTAARESQGIRDQVESEKGKAVQSVAELEEQLAALKRQVDAIAENVGGLKAADRTNRDNMRRAFEEMGRAIAENREQINTNTEEIAKIPEEVMIRARETFATAAPPTSSPSSSPSPSSPTQTTAPAEPPVEEPAASTDPAGNRIHVIESGDTFAKLSAKYNVRLSAIQAANPTVDPRRLQIGDRIIIPGGGE